MARPGRPPNEDRSKVTTGLQMAIRLTPEERGWLDELVEIRRSEVDGATFSAAGVLRGLLRREAIARGLVAGKAKTKREPRSR